MFRISSNPVFAITCTVTVALLLIATACFAMHTARYNSGFTTDSILYVDCARQLVRGDGYTTRIAGAGMPDGFDLALPFPVAMHPPLYSVAIAAGALFGFTELQMAIIVPILGYVACIFLIGLIVYCHSGFAPALLAAALAQSVSPLRIAASHAWSETLGMAFVLCGMAFLVWYPQRPAKAGLAGLFFGASFLTRYALSPLLAMGMAYVALWGKAFSHPRTKSSWYSVCLFAGGAIVMILPLLIRNWWLVGNLGGPLQRARAIPLTQPLAATAQTLSRIWFALPLTAKLVIVGLPVCAVGVRFVFGGAARLKDRQPDLGNGAWVIGVGVLCYYFSLLYGSMFYLIDAIDERLLFPAIILLPMLGVVSLVRFSQWRGSLLAAAALVVASQTAYRDYNEWELVRSVTLPSPYDVDARLHRSETYQWLANRDLDDTLIVCIDRYDFSLLFGPVDLLVLMSGAPSHWQQSYDDLMAVVDYYAQDHHRAYYLIAPDPPPTKAFGTPFLQGLLDDLFAGRMERYPRLEHTVSLDDGKIYSIDLKNSVVAPGGPPAPEVNAGIHPDE